MESAIRVKRIRNVTLIGSLINIVLTIAKVIAGIVGHSSAMVADGIHSLSDFATDIVVIVFVKVSGKERDNTHHYGHGKFETFATMLISFALFFVGVGILITGTGKIIDSLQGELLEKPGYIALYAALISIISKEALFWWTKIEAKKLNSQAMIANAWHHRSDAFSSVGTAIGIAGAILLGDNWRILDPFAGIVVSIFILKVAWDIAIPSVDELLDSSLPMSTEKEIELIISKTAGIKGFHNLRTRKIGEIISVEVDIRVDKEMTVEIAHQIATEIENTLRYRFGKKTHVIIHIEPHFIY